MVLTHLAPGGLRRELGRCVEHLLGHLWRRHAGEKDAELGQRLGQLQPFIAVSSWKCVGQLVPFGSNLCILTQPNTFLAADQSLYRHGPRRLGRAHVPDGQVGPPGIPSFQHWGVTRRTHRFQKPTTVLFLHQFSVACIFRVYLSTHPSGTSTDIPAGCFADAPGVRKTPSWPRTF